MAHRACCKPDARKVEQLRETSQLRLSSSIEPCKKCPDKKDPYIERAHAAVPYRSGCRRIRAAGKTLQLTVYVAGAHSIT